jgi:hypothetical protein
VATLKILQDTDAFNPRKDFDHLGTMVCWHRNYNLGDEQPRMDPQDFLATLPKGSIVLPLFLYDHSGITMSTHPYHCPWDSGQVGYIYATPEKIRSEFNVKRISRKLRDKVTRCLEAEVSEYDDYLTGNVWGFQFTADDGTEDSCWGFFGSDAKAGIAEYLPDTARPLLDSAWDARS